MSDNAPRGNVVLVHGGFVDGAGWQGVHEALTEDGYNVAVVQNPTLSLDDDVIATRRVIDAQPGLRLPSGHRRPTSEDRARVEGRPSGAGNRSQHAGSAASDLGNPRDRWA